MENKRTLLLDYLAIREAARLSDDGNRCAVAPAPELKERIKQELAAIRSDTGSALAALAKAAEPQRPGFNDGLIIPPDQFPLGTPLSVIRSAAADRAPLRGTLRVIVVLVDFSDKQMTQTKQHYKDLFFSTGVIPTKSVREYYQDVTNGLIDIDGDVVGPFRLPQTIATYAHGASGIGGTLPNAQTMARDAVIASDPTVNFAPYDNDGNGFVDAFIVIHAGSGAEQTGSPNDIWSHKWTLDGGARSVDGTKIFGYLTVPEDSKIGVCAHELGHLLFGFPDLYDTDGSSEGIGNWCLMAAGSWGGGGDTPVHPSAWCKVDQGWVSVDVRTTNSNVNIPDVKSSHNVLRLWKDGTPGSEYFLVENRQQSGFDVSLPGNGLLIWHIDDSVSSNTNESHYKVALMQADGKRDMELNHNRGDGGDSYPGTSNNRTFNASSTPSSNSYAGTSTCVAVTAISNSAAVMTANVAVKCKTIEKTVIKDSKDIRDKLLDKRQIKEIRDKPLLDKRLEKPIIDKSAATDKGFVENPGGGLPGGGGGLPGAAGSSPLAQIESRLSALEQAVGSLIAGGGQEGRQGGQQGGQQQQAPTEPFIGQELRPDLTGSALSAEEDYSQLHDQMRRGSRDAKRFYDTKLKEQ